MNHLSLEESADSMLFWNLTLIHPEKGDGLWKDGFFPSILWHHFWKQVQHRAAGNITSDQSVVYLGIKHFSVIMQQHWALCLLLYKNNTNFHQCNPATSLQKHPIRSSDSASCVGPRCHFGLTLSRPIESTSQRAGTSLQITGERVKGWRVKEDIWGEKKECFHSLFPMRGSAGDMHSGLFFCGYC